MGEELEDEIESHKQEKEELTKNHLRERQRHMSIQQAHEEVKSELKIKHTKIEQIEKQLLVAKSKGEEGKKEVRRLESEKTKIERQIRTLESKIADHEEACQLL